MSFAGRCQVRALGWALGALCALGCGIAQRTVEERDADASGGGAHHGGTPSTGTNDGGRAAGAQAGKSTTTFGGKSAGSAAAPSSAASGPQEELGVELDPVPVSDPPLPACSCGEGCAQSICNVETLLVPSTFLMNVSVRDAEAYVMGLEQLVRSDLDSAKQFAVASQLQFPSSVVVDAEFAYFSSYVGLWKVPREAVNVSLATGEGAKLLTTLEQWKRRLTELTVDSRHVYWTNPVTDQIPARLTRTSLADGKSTVLARLENDDDWPLGIAVDDTNVYLTSNARLLRVPKRGGEPEELERIDAQVSYDQIHPLLSIALDERWIYYDAGTALRRFSKADGTSITLFNVPAGDALSGIVVDEYYVYFGTRSGSIYRSDKAEGPPRVIVTGESKPLVSAVTRDAVYWVAQDQARVRSVRK